VAHKRPTASDVITPTLTCLDGGRSRLDEPRLTRAEAHALRRSATLTHAQLAEYLNGLPEPPQRSA
jgi:DNA-binding transcriptional regulator YiaG